MKGLISLVLLSAFAVTLFSPTVAALQWDWRKPPPESVIKETQGARPNGDDMGWGDTAQSPPSPWSNDWINGLILQISMDLLFDLTSEETSNRGSEATDDSREAGNSRKINF